MARTGTSRHGGTEGYILLDAVIALLLSITVAGSVLPALRQALRSSEAALERTRSGIEKLNEKVEEGMDELAP